jgi:hypothetical protein
MSVTVDVAVTDDGLACRLQVSCDDPDAAAVRVTRSDALGEERVPGGLRLQTGPDGDKRCEIVDAGVMFDSVGLYRVQVLDAAGAVTDGALVAAPTVPGPPPGTCVLSLDVDPTRRLVLGGIAVTDHERVWGGPVETFTPAVGGPPVAMTAGRAVESTVTVRTSDPALDRELAGMVASGAPITIRARPVWPLAGRWRKAPDRVARTRVASPANPAVEWTFTGRDVAPDWRDPMPLETWADWVSYCAAADLTEADVAARAAANGLTALDTTSMTIAQLMGE